MKWRNGVSSRENNRQRSYLARGRLKKSNGASAVACVNVSQLMSAISSSGCQVTYCLAMPAHQPVSQ